MLLIILVISLSPGCSKKGEELSTEKNTANVTISTSASSNEWKIVIEENADLKSYNFKFKYLGKADAIGPTLSIKDSFKITATSIVRTNTVGLALEGVTIPQTDKVYNFEINWIENSVNKTEKIVVKMKIT